MAARAARWSSSPSNPCRTCALAGCPTRLHRAGPVATVALVGNPNVGKSTLFNTLTGARQRVGNWPGTTVRVASGTWNTGAGPVTLVDLPGSYGLAGHSPAEALVRQLLTGPPDHRPDLVVVVVDAANLTRNLYQLGQVLDTGAPVVAALTMLDTAQARGLRLDVPALADQLGVPVVPLGTRARTGRDRLASAVTDALTTQTVRHAAVATGGAEQRHPWAQQVAAAGVRRPERERPTTSDRIDRVLTRRWLGLPAFLCVMWTMLAAATWLAAPLQAGLAAVLDGPVTGGARSLLRWLGVEQSWVAGLLVDGVVAGAGQLLTFVPLMAVMFLLLSVLEDSGYLARAAFAADRFLRRLGLPGQALLPLVVGFGCNVPAVAATRALPNPRHRLLAGLLVPYVTCSARLVVYAMLASVFFGRYAGSVVFGMYVLSLLLVLLIGLGLRRTAFRDLPSEPLVLELPPYRLPTPRVVAVQTWQHLAGFLRKAAGPIVATVTVVWLLTAIPLGGASGGFGNVEVSDSAFGGVSQAAAVVFAPAGFDDWRTTGALVSGFVAKEAVVSTLAQTHAGPHTSLAQTFEESSGGHPGPAALAFLVFVLAYTPCVATLAAQRAELGWLPTAAGAGLQLTVAWSLATLVFQVSTLLV